MALGGEKRRFAGKRISRQDMASMKNARKPTVEAVPSLSSVKSKDKNVTKKPAKVDIPTKGLSKEDQAAFERSHPSIGRARKAEQAFVCEYSGREVQ